MRFVVPMEVTAANLTSNVTNDEATWSAGTYALGYIDDVRDPIEAIRGGSGAMSFGDLDHVRPR